MTRLAVAKIKMDPALQGRTGVNFDVVKEYAALYAQGTVMKPIMVFRDGDVFWLADGFHRVHAAFEAGVSHVDAEIKDGTKADAIWFSASANTSHGLPRRNEDKRRAVKMALACERSRGLSDRAIAEHCAVTADLVGDIRRQLSTVDNSKHNSVKGKDGKTYSKTKESASKAGKASAKKKADAKAERENEAGLKSAAPPEEPVTEDLKPEPKIVRKPTAPVETQSKALEQAQRVVLALLPSERDALLVWLIELNRSAAA